MAEEKDSQLAPRPALEPHCGDGPDPIHTARTIP